MAVAGEATDARAILAHHQPIAVVFDFVNPERAGRRLSHLRRLAWFDEAGATTRHSWSVSRNLNSVRSARSSALTSASGPACSRSRVVSQFEFFAAGPSRIS